MSAMVAALYVETGGIYYGLPDVDPWDEERDARLYDGPWPVVAHPPCNRWVSYGAQELRGQDGGCFEAALAAVRRFGGVLEHPARSQAWREFQLPNAGRGGWTLAWDDSGYATEVDQWYFGFPTRKLTWLYASPGVTPAALHPGHARFERGCESLWSTDRSKTPPAFRDVLLNMARSVHVSKEHPKP